jgi:hypothetical protein
MEELRKLLIMLFAIVTAITTHVLVLQHGWGLEPQSWGWIIGVGFFGNLVARILFEVGRAPSAPRSAKEARR